MYQDQYSYNIKYICTTLLESCDIFPYSLLIIEYKSLCNVKYDCLTFRKEGSNT